MYFEHINLKATVQIEFARTVARRLLKDKINRTLKAIIESKFNAFHTRYLNGILKWKCKRHLETAV